jgi:hypothetical protein
MSDIAEAAYRDWQETTKQHLTHPDLWEYQREGFVAGYRRALQDAADAIQALHPGEVKNSVTFLRARAAAVGVTGDTGGNDD